MATYREIRSQQVAAIQLAVELADLVGPTKRKQLERMVAERLPFVTYGDDTDLEQFIRNNEAERPR